MTKSIKGSKIFRSGSSRKVYDQVPGQVRLRKVEDGQAVMLEVSIPNTRGMSDIGLQVPTEELAALFEVKAKVS